MNLHPIINWSSPSIRYTFPQTRAWLGIVSKIFMRDPPTLKKFFNLLTKESATCRAHELEVKVFPANNVPTLANEVKYELNNPIFEMLAEAVTNELADANAAVN